MKSNNLDLSSVILSSRPLLLKFHPRTLRQWERAENLHSFDIVVITLVATIYTYMLQSINVVHEKRVEEVPFEKIAQENYGFMSDEVDFFKRMS